MQAGGSLDSFEITQPDDWHLHLRDGEMLTRVLPYTARRFRRAIVMPNLDPPVTTVEQALKYRDRILAALPPTLSFETLMTLYLPTSTEVSGIDKSSPTPLCWGRKF